MLLWPYATKDPSMYKRIDQGWDLQGPPGALVYAVAPGTVHISRANPGGFGDDYPYLILDTPYPGGSTDIYYGHTHILPNLDGKHVDAGTAIARTNVTQNQGDTGDAPPGWLEIGFGSSRVGFPGDGTAMQRALLQASAPPPSGAATASPADTVTATGSGVGGVAAGAAAGVAGLLLLVAFAGVFVVYAMFG